MKFLIQFYGKFLDNEQGVKVGQLEILEKGRRYSWDGVVILVYMFFSCMFKQFVLVFLLRYVFCLVIYKLCICFLMANIVSFEQVGEIVIFILGRFEVRYYIGLQEVCGVCSRGLGI